MRKSWLRRIRRRLLAVVVGTLVVIAPLEWYSIGHPSRRWLAGCLVGALVTFVVAVRAMPPGYIEQWEQGAWGEKLTERELRPLRGDGWVTLHDRRDAGRRNFDHVAVGPGGVFLLDSKRWMGTTTIENGVPALRRLEDPTLPAALFDTLPRRHKGAAMRVRDALRAATRIGVWVQPVVVIWGTFPDRVVETDGVVYVHGEELAGWLRGRPAVLHATRTPQIAEGLRKSLQAA